MEITTLVVGSLQANCYLVGCEQTKEAVIIDPGGNAADIINRFNQLDYRLKYILNTHGHMDHVSANLAVKKALGGLLGIHQADRLMLQKSASRLAGNMDECQEKAEVDIQIEDGDTLEFGKQSLKVMHTPGHTAGGVCFMINENLFTGDTLFCGSVGRWDFPGGSYDDLLKSIRKKIMPLEGTVKVYPGHGPQTTIGEEKNQNPFLQGS